MCVGKLTIIGSDNCLSPGRRQAIIWINAGILLIEPLGTNFIEILNGIQTFSFKKMHLKMSSAKWRPFCLGLNVLINQLTDRLSSSLPPYPHLSSPSLLSSSFTMLVLIFITIYHHDRRCRYHSCKSAVMCQNRTGIDPMSFVLDTLWYVSYSCK